MYGNMCVLGSHAWAYTGKPEIDTRYLSQLREGLSLEPTSILPQGFSFSASWWQGLQMGCCTCLAFTGLLGIWASVFRLAQQRLHPLGHLPVPIGFLKTLESHRYLLCLGYCLLFCFPFNTIFKDALKHSMKDTGSYLQYCQFYYSFCLRIFNVATAFPVFKSLPFARIFFLKSWLCYLELPCPFSLLRLWPSCEEQWQQSWDVKVLARGRGRADDVAGVGEKVADGGHSSWTHGRPADCNEACAPSRLVFEHEQVRGYFGLCAHQ